MKLVGKLLVNWLLVTGMAQGYYNWQRGLTDVALGLSVASLSAHWLAHTNWSVVANAMAQAAIADAGADLTLAILYDEARPELHWLNYGYLRVRHAAAMLMLTMGLKALALGKGGYLDQLPIVGAGLAFAIGEWPWAYGSYFALTGLLDQLADAA